MSFYQNVVLPTLYTVRALLFGLGIGLLSAFGMVLSYPSFDALKVRQWVAYPTVAQMKSDAYAKAVRARLADLPLDPAIGLAFMAYNDSDGQALDAACSYHLQFALPQTRLWTLAVLPQVQTTPLSQLVETGQHVVASSKNTNSANAASHVAWTQTSLLSGDVIFDAEGHADVTVSREAYPGNWLALPTATNKEPGQEPKNAATTRANAQITPVATSLDLVNEAIGLHDMQFSLALHLYGLAVNAEYFLAHQDSLPLIKKERCS